MNASCIAICKPDISVVLASSRLHVRPALLVALLTAAVSWSTARPLAAQTYQGVDLYTIETPAGYMYADLLAPDTEFFASTGQFVSAIRTSDTTMRHAVAWNHANGNFIDLHPGTLPGIVQSAALSASGAQQVGWGLSSLGRERALLWSGSSGSAVNLHPAGYVQSRAIATNGSQQVGMVELVGDVKHAALWNGAAASVVDLHPTSLAYINWSQAFATTGAKQAGYGLTTQTRNHALLWSGTAASVLDIHPSQLNGIGESKAIGAFGNQQVGSGLFFDFYEYALMWNGTAASAVNLHPDHLGFLHSRAWGTNGTIQVGGGLTFSESEHALLWSGSAASAIDLHPLLPPGFYVSQAHSVDAQGNIYGVALDESDRVHAVRWSLPSAPSPADFDGNGVVDGVDLQAWRSGFGTAAGAAKAQGDADADGDVDGVDFLTWQRELGGGSAVQAFASPVPEPAGRFLVITSCVAIFARRRHAH